MLNLPGEAVTRFQDAAAARSGVLFSRDSGPLPSASLVDLPEHRRESLLWRYALELDYDGVDDLVRVSSTRPCRWQGGPWPADTADPKAAVLGDDGRFHLCVGGMPLCAKRLEPGEVAPPAGHLHEQWCFWWTDGIRYRIQRPPTEPDAGEHTTLTVTWTVTLTDVLTDPTAVRSRERCTEIGTRQRHWPAHHNLTTPLGRVRAALVDALGGDCHACGRRAGVFVDHDHLTGAVRGLLCIHCNTWIDDCPHPSGCRWADYLNTPPAANLALRYPERRGTGRRHQATVAYLGFDPATEPRR